MKSSYLLAGAVTHVVVFAGPFSADWLSRTADKGLATRPVRLRSAICNPARRNTLLDQVLRHLI